MNQRQYVNVPIPLDLVSLVDALLSGLDNSHYDNDQIGLLIFEALMSDDTMPLIQSLTTNND